MNKKNRRRSSKTLDEMGLWLSKKKLCYTAGGYLKWMPYFIKRKIVHIWNRISCSLFGHYWFPDYPDRQIEVCVDCMTRRLK